MKRFLLIITLTIFYILALPLCCALPRGEPISLYRATENKLVVKQCTLPVLYMINKDVPENIKKMIVESFNYWDNLTDKKLFLNIGETDLLPGDMCAGMVVVVGVEELIDAEHKNAFAYAISGWNSVDGCVDNGGIVIYKKTIYSLDTKILSILRHEVGHILGFIHSPHTEDLMHSSIGLFDWSKEVSEWELKAFMIYYGN